MWVNLTDDLKTHAPTYGTVIDSTRRDLTNIEHIDGRTYIYLRANVRNLGFEVSIKAICV